MIDLETSLSRAARRTFEELVFFLPDTDTSDRQEAAKEEARACVAFNGPFSGFIQVRLFGNLLPELSANMLGNDETSAESMQMDAFGEVTNVICGHLLPEIAGPSEVFELAAPKVGRPDWGTVPVHQGRPTATAVLGLEEGRAELGLFLDPDRGRDLSATASSNRAA